MGNFLEDLFNKVFKDSGKSPMNLKENYVLKDSEIQEAEVWIKGEEGQMLLAKLYKNYHFKRAQINDHPQVHIFDSRYAKGFAITFEDPFTPQTFSRVFLAFAQRVLALGYQQVSLDRKMEEVNDQVKVTEKFYFKPPLQIPVDGEQISQLYGNIAIEKVSVNNQPNYLKFLATFYSDRLYQDPKPFDHMLDRLFDANTDGQNSI